MKSLLKAITFAGLATCSALASAELYIAAGAGQTDVDLDGFDEATSYSFTAGVDISQHFSVEGSYIDLGDAEDDIWPRWTVSADGVNAALVARLPLTEQIEVFAKGGVFFWDADLEEEGYGQLESDDGTDFSAALGLSIALTRNLNLTAQYMTIDLDDTDIDNLSAGLELRF